MYLICPNCLKHLQEESQYKFEDVEEDMMGRDVITFKCGFCKNIGKSLVYVDPSITDERN